MIERRTTLALGACALAVTLAASAHARAQSVEDFYTHHDITMIVGSGVGGGYDTYSRTFARHYSNHIPGHPDIVAKNMPGAASLQATNFLYNAAPRDGTVFAAIYNGMGLEPLLGNRAAKFDAFKLDWIGSIGKQQNICVTWHTSPIKTLKQAIGKKLTVSATGATGNSATTPRIFNALIGTDFQVILGYSTSGSRLALERGEVDGICGLSFSTLMASNPDWILQHKLNILAQFGMQKLPQLPDVPSAIDFAKSEQDRKVMQLLLIPKEMGRPIVATPDVPKDRIAALRKAFMETMKDPAFLKDAKRTKLMVDPIDSDDVYKLLHTAYSYPKSVAKAAAELIGRPKQGEFVTCGKYTKQASWCKKKKKK